MKGNAGRGKRIAAITAAILTFTGVQNHILQLMELEQVVMT